MADRIISDDGKWMWTGSEWIPSPPNSSNEKTTLPLSDDGKWMWNGSEWIPNNLEKEENTDNNWWSDSEPDSSSSKKTIEEKGSFVQDSSMAGIPKMPKELLPRKPAEIGRVVSRKLSDPTSRVQRQSGIEPISSGEVFTVLASLALVLAFLVVCASMFSTIFVSDEFGTTNSSNHQVSYYVHAESQSVDITISNSGGGTSQFSNVPMWDENGEATPWTYDFTANLDGFTFLYVSAQINQDCECKIQAMIYVDGVRTQFSQSEGAYVIATASEMR